MGINQAIYTSSARGISKGGGMGIHAYNYSCSEAELSEFELSYCQYYFNGDISEIDKLPTKIVYGKTQEGRYIEASITYLGKDYDKESGRMGNFLSHMYSFDKEDLCVYPMQLYGSPNYRTSIADDEVNGTREVSYLPPTKKIYAGNVTTIESVQKFLNDGRMEMFCHLMGAVLHIDQIHKVIIYDVHDNIVIWLAAIEYALPIQCAKEITFSSYEREPMISEFDIRGAVAGMSQGAYEDYISNGQFFVFDGIDKEYPRFDISSDYFQYGIKMGLALSYESMTEFFKFMERYHYEKANDDIYIGFKLFQILQGSIKLSRKEELAEVRSFEIKYGDKNSYSKMLMGLFKCLREDLKRDDSLAADIRLLIVEYYKKECNEEGMNFIIPYIINFEKNIGSDKAIIQANNEMWNELYTIMTTHQKEKLNYICDYLLTQELYKRLGELEAFYFRKSCGQQYIKAIQIEFGEYWKKIPKENYLFFDPMVKEAVKILKTYKNEKDQYLSAINLFLGLRKLGDGFIVGTGCEQLINMIEKGTVLGDKNQFTNKKLSDLREKQTKCAFEIFNYVQKENVDIPIGRIRLLHLGRCIAEAFQNNTNLTESKVLSIYAKFPVSAVYIENKEFRAYIEILTEIMYTMEISKENYCYLLTCWILNEEQKEILMNIFFGDEIWYLRKMKQPSGIESLLAAVIESGDAYHAALKKCVCELKDSHREKSTKAIKEMEDRAIYVYWKSLIDSDNEKRVKHRLLNFRK